MKRNTLSFKLIIRLLPAIILLGAAIFAAYYIFARNSIRDHTARNAEITAKNTVHSIEEIIKQAQMIPRNLSWMMESESLNRDSIYPFLKKLVENNPLIYASAIAFEPGMGPDSQDFYSPYAYRSGKTIEAKNLGSESYNYYIMDWYQIPSILEKPYWTEPYFDEGGADALLSTYSHPFYLQSNGKREFAGIITIDISLDWLTQIVNSVRILETGYAFLISGNGVYVTHPDESNIMNHSIFTRAKELGLPEMRVIGRKMTGGSEGFSSVTLPETGRTLLYFKQLPSSGWSLGVAYPNKEMYASLHKLNLLIVLLSSIALVALFFFTFAIIRRQLRPLSRFAGSAREIAGGNFSVALPQIKSDDEMKELHNSFEFMQKEIAQYIEHLKETTSAKEKIESELRIAKEIQMGMIPHIFPPFPHIKTIDLHASLESAKEVGGDLYDFFLLDNSQLCFAIGDVSGKGIPASLFMAVTRTLLRSLAQKEKSTSQIISEMNGTLCLNNESNMFVTLFLGILDTANGSLRYCNAGHNPPVLVKKDGSATFFNITKGIPLGLFNDFSFVEENTTLAPGEQLFMYTDGLTEAENAQKNLYSDERLLQTIQNASANHNTESTQNESSSQNTASTQNESASLNTPATQKTSSSQNTASSQNTSAIASDTPTATSSSPAELTKKILLSVKEHVKGNEQSDDLTMMSILYRDNQNPPPENNSPSPKNQTTTDKKNSQDHVTTQIKVQNTINQIPTINQWIEETIDNWQLKPALTQTLQLIIEECFTNTVFYAYEQEMNDTIQISLTLKGNKSSSAGSISQEDNSFTQEDNSFTQEDNSSSQEDNSFTQEDNSASSRNALIIEIKDNGKYFDPTKKDNPDITLSAQERQIGGLGIFLVKQMTDNITYRRTDNHNILTIQKNL